jgi:hypothetical protein
MIQLQEVPGSRPVRLAIKVKKDTPEFYGALVRMLKRSGTCHISFQCDQSHRIRVYGILPRDIRVGITLMGGTVRQLSPN